MENQVQNPEVLAIVELEDRFETTVAALDAARCSDNNVSV
jgi:hypothetical protein